MLRFVEDEVDSQDLAKCGCVREEPRVNDEASIGQISRTSTGTSRVIWLGELDSTGIRAASSRGDCRSVRVLVVHRLGYLRKLALPSSALPCRPHRNFA